MLEPENVEIDGMRFQLLPMPLMEARRWDVRTLQLLAPIFGALDGIELSVAVAKGTEQEPTEDAEEINDLDAACEAPEGGAVEAGKKKNSDDVAIKSFASIAEAIGAALRSLSDAEQSQLIRAMLKNVTYLGGDDDEAAKNVLLDSERAINMALTGTSPLTLYMLIFHVARYNKFTPFALAAVGAKHKALANAAKKVAQGLFSTVSGT